MAQQRRSRDESFIVRIRSVDAKAGNAPWLATVVHVASGERRHVTNYGDLSGFIETRRDRSPRCD
jgi:hypothetical protein